MCRSFFTYVHRRVMGIKYMNGLIIIIHCAQFELYDIITLRAIGKMTDIYFAHCWKNDRYLLCV
jgi:hypothetical protein